MFSFKEMRLKMSCATWRIFSPGEDEITQILQRLIYYIMQINAHDSLETYLPPHSSESMAITSTIHSYPFQFCQRVIQIWTGNPAGPVMYNLHYEFLWGSPSYKPVCEYSASPCFVTVYCKINVCPFFCDSVIYDTICTFFVSRIFRMLFSEVSF